MNKNAVKSEDYSSKADYEIEYKAYIINIFDGDIN